MIKVLLSASSSPRPFRNASAYKHRYQFYNIFYASVYIFIAHVRVLQYINSDRNLVTGICANTLK